MFNSFINDLTQDLSMLSQNPVLNTKYIGSSDDYVQPFKTGWKRGVELGQSHIIYNLKHKKIKLQNALFFALIYQNKETVSRLHYDLASIINQFDSMTTRLAITGFVSDSSKREYSLTRYLLRYLDTEITSLHRSIHKIECDRFAITSVFKEITSIESEHIANEKIQDGYLAGLSACNVTLNSRFISSKNTLANFFSKQVGKKSNAQITLDEVQLLIAISKHVDIEKLSSKTITESDYFSNYVLDMIKPENINNGTYLSLLINEAREELDGQINASSVARKVYDKLTTTQKADLIFKLANLRTK